MWSKFDGVVLTSFSDTYKMPRKKRVVEGAVLDLTGIEGEAVDIEALLAAVEEKKEVKPPPPKRTPKTDEDILAAIYAGDHCSMCRRSIFTAIKFWKGKKMCINCHTQCRKTQIPHELTEYVRGVYKKGCSFCDTKVGRFHLDHVNMFNKVNSVYTMMMNGDSSSNIIAEIDKCQLLCINCHGLVTKFESKRGFISKKKELNKKIARGDDISELRGRLYEEYEGIMTKMYPLIREKATYIWPESEDIITHCGGREAEAGDFYDFDD
jgi:hypothetical protein